MESLSQEQLHRLRLVIFDNAESLYKEAKVLFESGYFARAYLLAHFAVEELGKIPIVVGVAGRLITGQEVDWPYTRKRFRDHRKKVRSDDHHHYMFALDPDPLADRDLEWLKEAHEAVPDRVERKNHATYVDVIDGNIQTPLECISREDAQKMIDRAFDSLRAHWQTENLTNPVLRRMNRERGSAPDG